MAVLRIYCTSMMLLVTSSVMYLNSLSVLSLSRSYTLIQMTQLGLIRLQLVTRWLLWLHGSPLLNHSYLEDVAAASVVSHDAQNIDIFGQ